jgi:hypothetical protein
MFWRTAVTIWLTGLGVGFDLCAGLYLPVLIIYVTEMFPTKSCSTLTSVAWSVG